MEQLKCSTCEKIKPVTEFGKRQNRKRGYDSLCRVCRRDKRRARILDYRDRGLCINCGGWDVLPDCSYLCVKCVIVRRRASLKYVRRLRHDVWDAYGGRFCRCCGETEEYFLTIDHVDGGGSAHRREIRATGQSSKFYLWLRDNAYPSGFQVLCQNCNVGKWRNGGRCPHDTETDVISR